MKSGTISIATCVVITDAYIQHLSRDPILKKRREKNINIREQFLAMIHHERPLLLTVQYTCSHKMDAVYYKLILKLPNIESDYSLLSYRC